MPEQPKLVSLKGIFKFHSIAPSHDQSTTRPTYIFRSAQPYNVTDGDIRILREIGITTIFDLRSDAEIVETSKAIPLRDLNDLKRVSVPVFETSETNVTGRLMTYLQNDTQTVMEAYARMLAAGSKCFQLIFLHIRNKPEQACLIHCAIGKDRTGVAVALLLSLAGLTKQEIAEDYVLTNAGLEAYQPVVKKLLESMPRLWWDEDTIAAMLSVR
ncbi:hypothetical protein P7C71_g3699, partial [Lecanoromycetidae sp. Uapishka_2]